MRLLGGGCGIKSSSFRGSATGGVSLYCIRTGTSRPESPVHPFTIRLCRRTRCQPWHRPGPAIGHPGRLLSRVVVGGDRSTEGRGGRRRAQDGLCGALDGHHGALVGCDARRPKLSTAFHRPRCVPDGAVDRANVLAAAAAGKPTPKFIVRCCDFFRTKSGQNRLNCDCATREGTTTGEVTHRRGVPRPPGRGRRGAFV